MRDDEVAAELAGIALGRARVSAFMVSAAAAGAAGAVLAFSVRLAAPSGFTLTLSLTLLAAVVLGGLGSLTGALLGAALLTFLPDVATDLGAGPGLERHPGRPARPARLRAGDGPGRAASPRAGIVGASGAAARRRTAARVDDHSHRSDRGRDHARREKPR